VGERKIESKEARETGPWWTIEPTGIEGAVWSRFVPPGSLNLDLLISFNVLHFILALKQNGAQIISFDGIIPRGGLTASLRRSNVPQKYVSQ